MRAAEAIRLGSLVLKPVGGTQWNGEGGCAIGMGNIALSGDATYPAFFKTYRWMYDASIKFVLPCSCKEDHIKDHIVGSAMQLQPKYTICSAPLFAMVHLFNYHVFTTKDWTIDRLCEWVESVDPTPREQEPEVVAGAAVGAAAR